MDHPLIEDRGNGPVLKSCRITVNDLFPYLQSPNYQDETALEAWPVITNEELQALKQYIADHYEEVAEVNRRVDERIRREREAYWTPERLARSEETSRRMDRFRNWIEARKAEGNLPPAEERLAAFNQWDAHHTPVVAEAVV